MKHLLAPLLCLALAAPAPALADGPVIENATAERGTMGWRIEVTLSHPDTGWDHYASGWEVLDKAGNRLAYRELMHPHVHEQPFTRSLSNVMLPDGTRSVFIRAICSQSHESTGVFRLDLP